MPSKFALFFKKLTLLVRISPLLKLKLFVNPGIVIILKVKLTIERRVLGRCRVCIVTEVSKNTFNRRQTIVSITLAFRHKCQVRGILFVT